MTVDFDTREALTKRVLSLLDGQNWTNDPISGEIKHLVAMTVDAVVSIQEEEKNKLS